MRVATANKALENEAAEESARPAARNTNGRNENASTMMLASIVTLMRNQVMRSLSRDLRRRAVTIAAKPSTATAISATVRSKSVGITRSAV